MMDMTVCSCMCSGILHQELSNKGTRQHFPARGGTLYLDSILSAGHVLKCLANFLFSTTSAYSTVMGIW